MNENDIIKNNNDIIELLKEAFPEESDRSETNIYRWFYSNTRHATNEEFTIINTRLGLNCRFTEYLVFEKECKEEEHERLEKIKKDETIDKINKKTEELQEILKSQNPYDEKIKLTNEKLTGIDKVVYSAKEHESIVKRFKENLEKNLSAPPDGFRLHNFPVFEKQLGRIRPGLYLIGASPHVGKTTWMLNIVYSLLEWRENAEYQVVKICFVSFDDDWTRIVNRLVGIIAGITPTQAGRPNWDFEKEKERPDPLRTAIEAYQRVLEEIEENRLDIRDISDIADLESLQEYVKREVAKNGKKVVFFFDGILNLATKIEGNDTRQQANNIAATIKELVDIYQISVFTNVELRKLEGKRPTLDDFRETGQWGYNATVALFFTPIIEKKETEEEESYVTSRGEIKKRHIIEEKRKEGHVKIAMVKNKNNGKYFPFTETTFDTDTGRFEDIYISSNNKEKNNKSEVNMEVDPIEIWEGVSKKIDQ